MYTSFGSLGEREPKDVCILKLLPENVKGAYSFSCSMVTCMDNFSPKP